MLQLVDLGHKALPREALLQRGDILGLHLGSQQRELRRRGVGHNAPHLQLGLRFAQLLHLGKIGLRRDPRRGKDLHPALLLQALHHADRVFLVRNLFRLVAAMEGRQRRDVPLFLAGLVPHAGLLFHLPAQPRRVARRPDHPHRTLNKTVVAHQPQFAVLNVGDAVERIHQQPIGSLVQRQRHRIRRKVAAA